MKKIAVIFLLCAIQFCSYGQVVYLNDNVIAVTDSFIRVTDTIKMYRIERYKYSFSYNNYGSTQAYTNVYVEELNKYRNGEVLNKWYNNKYKILNIDSTLVDAYSYTYYKKVTDDFVGSHWKKIKDADRQTFERDKYQMDKDRIKKTIIGKEYVYSFSCKEIYEESKKENVSKSTYNFYVSDGNYDVFNVDSVLDYSGIKTESDMNYTFKNDSYIYDYDSLINYCAVFRDGNLVTKYREEDYEVIKSTVKLTSDQMLKLLEECPIKKVSCPAVGGEYELDYYGYHYEFSPSVFVPGDKMAKKVTLSVNFYNNIGEYKGHKDFTITGYTAPGDYMSADFDIYENTWYDFKIIGCKMVFIDDTSTTKYVFMSDITEEQKKWESENIIRLKSVVP